MVLCECILSDTTLEHIQILQKILQKDPSMYGRSETVEILLKYIVSNVNDISVNDLILMDDYFSAHPSFLHAFYNDFMVSATFVSNPYFQNNH
jgi:hypothetical protein